MKELLEKAVSLSSNIGLLFEKLRDVNLLIDIKPILYLPIVVGEGMRPVRIDPYDKLWAALTVEERDNIVNLKEEMLYTVTMAIYKSLEQNIDELEKIIKTINLFDIIKKGEKNESNN